MATQQTPGMQYQFVPLDPDAQYDEPGPGIAPAPTAPGGFVPLAPDVKYDIGNAIPDAVAQQSADNLRARPGPPQLEGWARDPALIGSGVAKGAATGMGAFGDMADLATQWVKDKLSPSATPAPPQGQRIYPGPFSMFGMPNSSAWLDPLRRAGAVDNPALTPQDTRERYITATAEGAGGAIPYLPFGGISAARALVGGGAGGAAGELGAEMFPEHPILARTIGNIAVGGAIGGAPRAGPNATEEAFNRLGIYNPLPGDTQGGWRQRLTSKVADMPMGGAVRKQQQQVMDRWGTAVDDIAENLAGPYGVPQTPQQAGSALQTANHNWLQGAKAESDRLHADAGMYLPPRTPMAATNYATTLSDIASTMPALPATGRRLTPDFTRNLLDDLMSDIQRGPPDWGSMSAARTRIGSMIADPKIMGGPNVTELRRIYGALTEDMRVAARAQGPQAEAAFDKAQAYTRDMHAYIDNTVSNFVGRRGATGNDFITPEQAYSNAMSDARLGGTLLKSVRDRMPEGADQLGAYELRERSMATPGQQGVPGQGQTRSPTTFVTQTNPRNLRPEAQDALFPGVRDQLNDLRQTAGAMRETERGVNVSKTGAQLSAKEVLDIFRNAGLGAAAGYAVGRLPGAAAGGVTGLLSPFVPGGVGSWLALRAPRNYPAGLLEQPARSYGGIAAPNNNP